jgi:GAF domain-containing protein/HAMP domain-containing protein
MVIAKFRFKTVWDIMSNTDVIGSGIVYMIDKQHRVIAHSNPSVVLQGTQVDLPAENDFTIGLNNTEVAMAREPISLNWQTFSVIAEQPSSEALSLAQSNFFITIAISAGMLILVAGLGTIAAQRITNPIDQLATIAQNISKGDLSLQANIKSEDEIGLLATAFNSMTSQLRDLIGSLEQRVAERTAELEKSSAQIQQRASQLETIADVASSVASLQDVNELLPYITKTISDRFGFYHVGIFLLSDDKEYAELRAANSGGGQKMLARKHKLRVGKEGIVGYVVDQKRARIALDVGDDAVYFDNPDLPTTRSEMALPLMVGGNVTGALDVQSEQPNAFSDEDIEVLSTLANQVAVAIENARLFQQSQDALRELDNTFQRYIKTEWQQFTAKSKVVGYRANESGLEPIIEEQTAIKSEKNNGHMQTVPIKLRGTTLGSLNINMGNRLQNYADEEQNLIQTIADRLALALESARLLDESQRTAAKEQVIGEITGKIGSSINLRNVLQTAVEELGRNIPGAEIVIELTSKQDKAQGLISGEIK